MRVHLGTDHAGFELKEHLLKVLTADGHDVVDHGATTLDPEDDYPPFCLAVGEAVHAEQGSLGVVIGGSGNGEQIAANKVRGIRAALAYDPDTARLAREHNDANVLSLGARKHTLDEATELARVFLATPFSGEERHERRISLVAFYEQTGQISEG